MIAIKQLKNKPIVPKAGFKDPTKKELYEKWLAETKPAVETKPKPPKQNGKSA